MKFLRRAISLGGALLALCPLLGARPRPESTPASRAAATEKQLEKYAHALKQKNPSSAYAGLSAIAGRKSSGVLAMRAALALGYFDYTSGHYAQAIKWLDQASGDSLLAEYPLYWRAETELAMGNNADALTGLLEFRKAYPDSVMTDEALQSLGVAALAANRPADAIAALDDYPLITERPPLLFLRAELHEQANQPFDAVADYLMIYTRYSVSEQARDAGIKLDFLQSSMRDKFPGVPVNERLAHAAILFNAKDWGDARNEYSSLLPQLSGAEQELATLRIQECGVALGASPDPMIALKISDPDADAERYYALAGVYRDRQQEPAMAAAVESAVSRAAASRWAEAALFLAGNYYWVQLDRDRAAGYYKRLEEQFPSAPDADAAQWRVAWTAVIERQPGAADLLEAHLRRFPGSSYTSDALYWLGRLAEEAGNAPLARSYYAKLSDRYPMSYFQLQAANRLRGLGLGPKADPDILAAIPAAASPAKLDDPIPAAAASNQARADALRSIAFDASAELELQAAYASTAEPRFLLESAQAAADDGQYGEAILITRQIYPQLDAYQISDVPREAWLAAYAIPFKDFIRRWSAKAGVDPMLVAGLIRQESAFEPNAHSPADARGLMQVLPKTGRLLARQLKIRYSEARLFEPDYNVRLGTAYLADLRKEFGGVEFALAAYNAGEDRLSFWTAGRTYREPAEFTESIPFTETRRYVQIVTRNAEVYRQLYGADDEPRAARTRRKR